MNIIIFDQNISKRRKDFLQSFYFLIPPRKFLVKPFQSIKGCKKLWRDKMLKEKHQDLILLILTLGFLFIFILSLDV